MVSWRKHDERLQPLSGLDAMFLYLEMPHAPMHVGGLAVLEGGLSFERFRAHLASRLHLVKSLRQRLVTVPLDLARPYWIEDPAFNIDWHLHHTALPKPGDWRHLRKLSARLFSRPLDRTRPLWEITFVEGLDTIPQVPPGSVALISKIHHAAIDGMSGADILGVLFDLSSEPRQLPAAPARDVAPVPTPSEVLAIGAYQLAKRPLMIPRVLVEAAKATLQARSMSKAEPENAPTLPFSAPPTPINAPISADRIWNTALLSLDRVKKLKQIAGCTVNDVVLAVCAGALRRYLESRGQLPDKPLVSMVPMSTRTSEEKNTMGNRISAMFVQLATDVADPVERLRRIQQNTGAGKTYQGAIDARGLMEASELVPFGLAAQAARLYSKSNFSNYHRPAFNCVITNVPGPQVPLYLAGGRLLAHMGMAPIIPGMGLIITVFTYDGVMSISSLSSPAVMPDLDEFSRMIRESANELEAALLPLEVKAPEPVVPKQGVGAFFEGARARLQKQPDLKLPATGVYQFDVTGEDAQRWIFDLSAAPPRIDPGETDQAICKLSMDAGSFMAMASGKLDGTAAFMQGKLKVDGDINAAIGFGKVLAILSRGERPRAQ